MNRSFIHLYRSNTGTCWDKTIDYKLNMFWHCLFEPINPFHLFLYARSVSFYINYFCWKYYFHIYKIYSFLYFLLIISIFSGKSFLHRNRHPGLTAGRVQGQRPAAETGWPNTVRPYDPRQQPCSQTIHWFQRRTD